MLRQTDLMHVKQRSKTNEGRGESKSAHTQDKHIEEQEAAKEER